MTDQKDQLPELLSTKDLVNLGFWPYQDAAFLARRKGNSPDFLRIGSKILYTKTSVFAFIEKHSRDGSIPYETFKLEEKC